MRLRVAAALWLLTGLCGSAKAGPFSLVDPAVSRRRIHEIHIRPEDL